MMVFPFSCFKKKCNNVIVQSAAFTFCFEPDLARERQGKTRERGGERVGNFRCAVVQVRTFLAGSTFAK